MMGKRARADEPILCAEGIFRHYSRAQVSVLRGVDFRIYQGEVVALVGASGSGKSSLLHILGCLDRPSAGRVRLLGRDVTELTRTQQAWVRLHYIGFVFQSFNLLPTHTALENVTLPLFYQRVERGERERRAMALLDRMGIAHRAHHVPGEMSGGERQRVAIARACVTDPRLLLADEPTGALDSKAGRSVLELLAGLHAERALTIVIVTHDANVAAFAQRQVVMRDGQIS